MQVGFICPDGGLVKHEDCLKQCRMPNRCACITTLTSMSRVRTWTGKASVTQLLRGTREAYLTIKEDFYMSPQKMMYSDHGMALHAWQEQIGNELGFITEREHPEEDITGIFDLLMPLEGQEGLWELDDYKTWGSYKMMKILGYYQAEVETGGVYKSGPREGQPRTRKEIFQSDDQIDWEGTDLQFNMYRIYCEKKGYKIGRMRVEVRVRDGGLQVATRRGVKNNIYYLDVPFLPDAQVLSYFKEMNDKLIHAVENNEMPEVCSDKERWNENGGNRKCKTWCAVWQHCDHGRKVHEEESPFDDNVD